MNEIIQTTLFAQEQQELTSNDYYTPKWIFDALDLQFDLDVASPPKGVPHIPKKHYFTQKDNGLERDWFGRVWMNPPFNKPQPWVSKFITHGNGVAVLPVSKSKWFHSLWLSDIPMVLLPPDLKFIDPKGGNGSIFMSTIMIAIGDENEKALEKIGKLRR